MQDADLPYEDELINCCECAAEPATEGQVQEDLENEGWDFSGQFGPRCPECVSLAPPDDGEEGLDALAEAVGAEKAPEPVAEPAPKPKRKRKVKR